MQTISSISEFLLQAGTQYRVFDLGRGIRKLDSQSVLNIENGDIAAPFPRQQMCWLAFVFWNKTDSQQHYLWFVKLPLDEQGLVVTGHRDRFLSIIVEALGEQLSESKNQQLPENPYSFQPTQQQMADFNAIVKQHLKLPPHEQFEQCISYLRSPQVMDWSILSLQSLSDVGCRINNTDIAPLFIKAAPALPTQVLYPLLSSIENQSINVGVTEYLCQWLLEEPQPRTRHQLIRALSQSKASGLVYNTVFALLNKTASLDDELFIVIVGRLWWLLGADDRLVEFFEILANYDNKGELFTALYTDLASQPALRDKVLAVLREPKKSLALQSAIGLVYSKAGGLHG